MNFVPVTYDNVELYQKMYVKYIGNDIKQYSRYYQAINPSQRELEQEALDYFSAYFDICLICNDDSKFVGFFITCNPFHPCCPKRSDFHITEFYIAEEYRKLGIATEVVNKLLEDKKGKTVSLHVLSHNAPALGFWHKVLLAHATVLTLFPTIDADCNLYIFTVN